MKECLKNEVAKIFWNKKKKTMKIDSSQKFVKKF